MDWIFWLVIGLSIVVLLALLPIIPYIRERKKERKLFPAKNPLVETPKKLIDPKEMVRQYVSLMGPGDTKENLTRYVKEQMASGFYAPVSETELTNWIDQFWKMDRAARAAFRDS